MPRYLVERSFPNGLVIPMTDAGADTCNLVIGNNAEGGVTWVPGNLDLTDRVIQAYNTGHRAGGAAPGGARPPAKNTGRQSKAR